MLKIYEKVIFLAIVLCTLSIYIISLAPGITVSNLGMDTGEFALCARDLGIPHPTGYPVFNLIGKIFCMNPLVQNREIAYRTNVLSAVFAAFTVGILYLILKILTGNVLISVFAALCFGVTKTFWSQAVITEVYTLNLFFVSLFIFFAVNYIKNKSEEKYFWGCTFAIGMGLTNHTICILLIPVYFFLIYLKPSIITIKKVSFGLFIIALCGFSYMYLPIRAVKDPVINIGNPGNLKNLFWVLMAKPFQHNMFSFPSGKLYYQISEYPILMQFTLFEILIGVIGFWELLKKQTEICFALLILFLLNIGYSLNYDISDIGAYFLLSYLIYAVWIGFGFKSIYESLGSFIDKFFSVKLLLIAFGIILIYNFNLHIRSNFTVISEPRREKAFSYAEKIFRDIHEKDAVFFVFGANQIIPLQYYKYETMKNSGPDIVDVNWIIWDWHLEQLKRRNTVKIPEINLEKLAQNVNNKYSRQIKDASSKIAPEAFLRNEVIRLVIRKNIRFRSIYTNCSYPLLEDEFYFAKIRKGLFKLAIKHK